ncbi:Acyl-CoA dehydrogenase, middle domain containing protein, putative [Angomonas deanei]|uniref:Acyl-CoA dehydrogenase, middle domain containing protein, putative n=1 Tax=Angomonas deanei TaxID=59799 RepID=A0A7G2CQA8_9TRYP|nr:Acyl-CoA dehydrogenase, middle domain containing protein, putative [Angomonas deanei]
MTAACVPSLEVGGPSFQPYIEKMTTPDYDGRDIHVSLKRAATCGMSMTEKQGGSDVRQNTTYAVPLEAATAGQSGASYRIVGHKWFTSAPMSDSFLTLAYSGDNELSCFLLPRWVAARRAQRRTALPAAKKQDGGQVQRQQ